MPIDVGQPVVAKDPNDDTLSHTFLAGQMQMGSTLAIPTIPRARSWLRADAELDHESKPTHTVTVTATDPHGVTDMITVTIHVTDVDEAPQHLRREPEGRGAVQRGIRGDSHGCGGDLHGQGSES